MKRPNLLWLAGLLVLGTSVALPRHAAEHGPVLCPLRLVTGLPCPGCGLTRAFVACGHGDFADAAAFHPFAPLLFLALTVVVAWRGAELMRGRPLGLTSAVRMLRPLALLVATGWLGWALLRAVTSPA